MGSAQTFLELVLAHRQKKEKALWNVTKSGAELQIMAWPAGFLLPKSVYIFFDCSFRAARMTDL